MKKPAESTAEREIVITRVIDAPRERVWEAWTSPAQLEKWWGPNGFTTRTKEFALEPGGVWTHTLRGPDGTEYPNQSRFEEVVRFERIVYSHGGGKEHGPGASFRSTVTFRALGPKRTELSLRMVFDTAAARELVVREFGAIEGGHQTLGRLADHVVHGESRGGEFVHSRVLTAPRARVFRAWTDAAELALWWGPHGFTNPRCEADARPGGAIRIDMRGPDGKVYPMTGEFHEVTAPSRLVFTSAVPGPDGTVLLEVHTTVVFDETEDGGTALTIRQRVLRVAPGGEQFLAGMSEGWKQSLERLAGHV